MIQMQTLLDVADNTGAKVAQCIKVLGGSKKRTASLGDVIVVSIKKSIPGAEVKPKSVVRAVIVRTRTPVLRQDGTSVKFDHNAIVILDAQGEPRGNRVFGAVARELRAKYMKIISLASEVV